ncbi:SGNH/GDSL hydrolase family protein [Stenotrophomonas sp. PUT21]|uniref:SGNH/GDSL hydrolase family protein n=1 Tax=Stenotrophomonas TaxID=40323 RepID=UPI003B767BCD
MNVVSSYRWAVPLIALALSGCGIGHGAAPTASATNARMECLSIVVRDMQIAWPKNTTVNIVAFGHSVPAGYGNTPEVNKRDAYPRLLEDALSERYPHAVLNVITAGIGGEDSGQGLLRMQRDVLDHHPRVVTIDYGLNDRAMPLAESRKNLLDIIGRVRAVGACPVLLTPTWDLQAHPGDSSDPLARQAAMIRALGGSENVPVADSMRAFEQYRGNREGLMAQFNHPNRAGHELVVGQLLPLFERAIAD